MFKYSFHYRLFFKIFYCPTRKEKKLYTYDKTGIPIIQVVEKRTTTIHQTNKGTRDDDKSSKKLDRKGCCEIVKIDLNS